MNNQNLILLTDAYKTSHWQLYPDNTTFVHSYAEARTGDLIQFFGLQIYLKQYLQRPITQQDINEAEEFTKTYGLPFYKTGWKKILKNHGGFLPLKIKSVDEGTNLTASNVLLTVENTDPEFYWLPSYVETQILRAIWYPTTVASLSKKIKNIILAYLKKNGDEQSINLKLHDFGARGVSSHESAMIGSAAHLVNFDGSDTLEGSLALQQYYDAPVVGRSIPATEHTNIIAFGDGKESEERAFRKLLSAYAKPGAVLACVSDTRNIYLAIDKLWGDALRQDIIDSGATLVIRPDSGDPSIIAPSCVHLLDHKFGHTVNRKGYKVLNNVRVIQGDGITYETISSILAILDDMGYSGDNITFGMGGALLQIPNRNTHSFAYKCSAVRVNDTLIETYKSPITDRGKASKKGILKLIKSEGVFKTVTTKEAGDDYLQERFNNGKLINPTNFAEVRRNSLID
ncbi:MAG: nicotinate phosphoribosyltransferase [Hydrotalea sp.]|nr:nicotinate phosphoribosyltransferase [Hydrotalea sp.]